MHLLGKGELELNTSFFRVNTYKEKERKWIWKVVDVNLSRLTCTIYIHGNFLIY